MSCGRVRDPPLHESGKGLGVYYKESQRNIDKKLHNRIEMITFVFRKS